MSFKFGASMEVFNQNAHKAIFNLEGHHPNDNLEKYNSGIEYWYKDLLALRVGHKFEYDAGNLSLGAGLKLPLGNYSLKADYGYFKFGFLDNVHRFSLGLAF